MLLSARGYDLEEIATLDQVDLRTVGNGLVRLTLRKRSFDFLSGLQELYRFYPTGPILLFLDNASVLIPNTGSSG